MRLLALWLVLFGVYASTVAIPSLGAADFAGDEPHHLMVAVSLVEDGDLDVGNQYAARAYAGWLPGSLQPAGVPDQGRLLEPQGAGLALLVAPAQALGGPRLVALLLAALAASGFVLCALLARRLVPEPWAGGGALLAGLSPPAVGWATAVSPELVAGTLLAGAALLTLRVRDDPRQRYAYGAAVLLALLPWLGARFLLPAAPIAVELVRWSLARRRRLMALVSVEALFASLVMYLTLNERLYGGPTPAAAGPAGAAGTGANTPLEYLERVPRLAELFVDRGVGLLRWAPFLLLAFAGAWLLWRSRRERVATAIPARREAEVSAGLLLAVCGAQILSATFLARTLEPPGVPPGAELVAALPCAGALAAWGLRHAPRTGLALGALTLLGTAWLLVQLWTGTIDGWGAATGSRAPWGPLVAAFPRFGVGSAWATTVAVALAVGLIAVIAREAWSATGWRRTGVRRPSSP